MEVAYYEQASNDVDYLFHIGFAFNLFTEQYVNILCELMNCTWHEQHEDIVGIFQYLKSPKTIDCLFNTTLTNFEYLDYDGSYALAVKCIWALGDIGTPKAKEYLKKLLNSENEIIVANAKKQLERKK